jgi:DNA-binding MarR family transcriptional regulator
MDSRDYMRARMTMRARVLSYVRAHPETTTVTLREVFGMDVDNLGNLLGRLREEGFVVQKKLPGQRAKVWSAVNAVSLDAAAAKRMARREAEADRSELPIIRVFAKEWTGHARDSWHNLFFGPAQVAA